MGSAFCLSIVLISALAALAQPNPKFARAFRLREEDGMDSDVSMELALQWMSETPLIDGHNDLAYFIKRFHDNRLQDIDLSVNISQNYDVTHTDIPRLRAGMVGAQEAFIFSQSIPSYVAFSGNRVADHSPSLSKKGVQEFKFFAAYSACASQYKDSPTHILDQIDVLKRVFETYPDDFQFVTSADGIEEAFNAGKIGSMIGVEGGHAIDSYPSVLRMLAELGVRYVTLTHSCNTPWADNWLTDGNGGDPVEFDGLSVWGKRLIIEMNRLGVFIDLSHVSAATMRDALLTSRAPVIFSHSSAYSVCSNYRNVPDEILPLVAANGGVIMVNFCTKYINCPPGHVSDNLNEAYLYQVVEHIEYLAEHCGYDYVGIGGDYDGVTYMPYDLEDVSKFPNLIAALIRRGWSEENVKKLLGDNLLRAMREMESVRDDMSDVLPLEDNMPRDSGGEADNECRTYAYNSDVIQHGSTWTCDG